MGLHHYTQDMSRIPLKYHTNELFYTKYTHPTVICRGTHGQTDGRTHARSENIYSIFRDKLLLLGEHVDPDAIASRTAIPPDKPLSQAPACNSMAPHP